MRLIDADELVKFLKGCTMSNGTLINTNTMLSVIDKIPTAYDVEKVVEELKEWSFETEIVIPTSDGFEDTVNREIICTLNAIDIVRKGGVDE